MLLGGGMLDQIRAAANARRRASLQLSCRAFPGAGALRALGRGGVCASADIPLERFSARPRAGTMSWARTSRSDRGSGDRLEGPGTT